MRRIAVVTVGRSDYGIYFPVLKAIQAAEDLELQLIVSGSHLSPEFGNTIEKIEADGFTAAARVEMLLSSDSPEGITKSMGLGTIGFAQAYAELKPDLLLVLGDRFEMHAAAIAAVSFRIPMAHIHGGELTFGAIDEVFRHSITKLSHLHFPTTEEYAARLRQMGEEDWRVTVSGAPALDNIALFHLSDPAELADKLGIKFDPPPVLVTFHSVTTEFDRTEEYIVELLAALESSQQTVLFTLPNPDTGGRIIIERIKDYVNGSERSFIVENLGGPLYFSVMKNAGVMVGNSSSGILEAPSFGLPVVNIGTRQEGRVRAANVIDVEPTRAEILKGIERALTAEFKESLADLKNPYGDGRAADVIVRKLATVPLDQTLLTKKFVDFPANT